MKPLVIIDFSHTASRMLFTAIAEIKPKKKDGLFITSDYSKYWEYLMFQSLQFIKNKFNGETIIAMDSSNNWRKDFYKEYKAHRAKSREDSEINFEEFYPLIETLGNTIRESFPFKVLKVPKAEADDIAGVISNKFGNERKIILVTSDKDWKQVMAENDKISMWDPIKKEFQILDEYEQESIETPAGLMSRFTVHHALLGDNGDNIPGIKIGTVFSPNFLSYLSKNNIDITPEEFNKLENKNELIDNYTIYKLYQSGPNKGKETINKDVYKTQPFGEVKARKASESKTSLISLLNENTMYKEAFIRNATLVDFNKIPQNLQDNIMKEYKEVTVNYDPNKILEYFMNEGLGQLVNIVNKFYDSSYEAQISTSLDDFF